MIYPPPWQNLQSCTEKQEQCSEEKETKKMRYYLSYYLYLLLLILSSLPLPHSFSLSLFPFPYRGLLEGIVGPTVVNVVTHAWNKQGQDLKIGQHLLQLWAILEESVAEMSHGEGVHPVMIGRVPVAFLNHHHKPREIKNRARRHVTCHVTYLAKLLRGILHLESSFMSSIMLMMHWEEEKINTILNTTT